MTSYTVLWRFDIQADNPRRAAEMAQEILRNDEYDWEYEVIDDITGEMIKVDLDVGIMMDEDIEPCRCI